MVVPLELEENSTLNADVWEAAGLQCNGTFPLERFSYDNRVLLNVIFRHLKETNFTGITVSGRGNDARREGMEIRGEEEENQGNGDVRTGTVLLLCSSVHWQVIS